MITHDEFQTKTMARIYADQGHFELAKDIINKLLDADPGNEELLNTLAEIYKKEGDTPFARLPDLFAEWFDLAVKLNRIKSLRNIKARHNQI